MAYFPIAGRDFFIQSTRSLLVDKIYFQLQDMLCEHTFLLPYHGNTLQAHLMLYKLILKAAILFLCPNYSEKIGMS